MVTVEILDVTRLEPKLKHPTIFKHFDELETGESFIIDNDHDPKPLYYQLLGERGNIFTWQYLEQGPQRWQVQITKPGKNKDAAAPGGISPEHVRKAAVIKEKGIDYSCGNSAAQQEPASAVAGNAPRAASQDYSKWNPGFLAVFISNTHHRYARDHAEIICGLTEKVAARHMVGHPELNRLAQSIPHFLQNLLNHIDKEEKIVFTAISQAVAKQADPSLPAAAGAGIIEQSALLLQKEHAIILDDLSYFRALTDGYRLPDDACNSYAYLYQQLAEMENDLRQYIRLENDILFPKAIALEQETAH